MAATIPPLRPQAVNNRLAMLLSRIEHRSMMTDVSDLRKGDIVDHLGRVMSVVDVSSSGKGRGCRSYNVLAYII